MYDAFWFHLIFGRMCIDSNLVFLCVAIAAVDAVTSYVLFIHLKSVSLLTLGFSVTTAQLDLVQVLICHAREENTVNWICSGWMKGVGRNTHTHTHLYSRQTKDRVKAKAGTDYGNSFVSFSLLLLTPFFSL